MLLPNTDCLEHVEDYVRDIYQAKSDVKGLKELSTNFLYFDRQFKVLLFLWFNPNSLKVYFMFLIRQIIRTQ